MSDPIEGYVNYQDRIVISECPEGEHSHWLPADSVDENGNGEYVCDIYSNGTPPSGEVIHIHVDK